MTDKFICDEGNTAGYEQRNNNRNIERHKIRKTEKQKALARQISHPLFRTYYKNRGECDFLIKEGQRVVRAIQVSYQIKENREREVNGLLEAMDAFKLKEGLIITEDKEEEERIDGREIVYMPLWKWLIDV